MYIKEIMKEVIAVDHDISIKEAAKIMSEKNIGSLVAIKDDEIFGILTEKDITKNITNPNKKISSVINKNVITVSEDQELDDAALIMKKKKIKHLPVTRNGKPIGIISSADIIEHSEEISDEFLFD